MTWPPIWTKDRPNILSPEISSRIKRAFEAGLVFGYHSYFCGGCSLDTWVFRTYDAFTNYVRSRSKPGDKFTVWSVPELVKKNLHLFSGAYAQGGQQMDLIVPPSQLDRVKAYLEIVEPEYAPHHMNSVLAIYSSPGDSTLKIEVVNLHYTDDWEEFVSELRAYSHPGGEVHIFPESVIDQKEHILLEEKYPNENGEVPIGGAY